MGGTSLSRRGTSTGNRYTTMSSATSDSRGAGAGYGCPYSRFRAACIAFSAARRTTTTFTPRGRQIGSAACRIMPGNTTTIWTDSSSPTGINWSHSRTNISNKQNPSPLAGDLLFGTLLSEKSQCLHCLRPRLQILLLNIRRNG